MIFVNIKILSKVLRMMLFEEEKIQHGQKIVKVEDDHI